MNTEHLKEEIESVFPFVKKPKGLELSFHKDDCHQCAYLRDDLEEYQDKELPPEAIRHIHQEMSCLSEQGWYWALPSYLRYSLAAETQHNQMEIEFLIYNLSPELEHQAETANRLSALDNKQMQCLLHFLEWCQQHEKWGQYCPDEISSGIEFLSTIRV